eukprot:TRINITY_DN9451_c0_g2_i1.p3 TRINITY_DN9451_c0_g2~~TRINITY_DN9451_c0_g2_i1.p3  ORF type:complete len:168 (-),score=28.48 TRINITY_DN9451_c0_g2_i1:20-496(-)
MLLKKLYFLSFSFVLSQGTVRLEKTNKDYNQIEELDIGNYGLATHSEQAWCIEFYSPRCSTCQLFNKVWTEVAKELSEVRLGSVNIDTDEGLELAKQVGVLEEGVPNVRCLLTQEDKNGVSVLNGFDVPTKMELLKMVQKVTAPNILGTKCMKLAPVQ